MRTSPRGKPSSCFPNSFIYDVVRSEEKDEPKKHDFAKLDPKKSLIQCTEPGGLTTKHLEWITHIEFFSDGSD